MFLRPKVGKFIEKCERNSGYRSWVGDLLDLVDTFTHRELDVLKDRKFKRHLIVGYFTKGDFDYMRCMTDQGLKDISISGSIEIDLAIIARPVLIGGAISILLLVALLCDLVSRIFR
jgi:hypothetical protein